MHTTSSYERKLHLEIAARWSPLLRAVGIDTTEWQPQEIFILAELVWRDKEVAEAKWQKLVAWNRDEKPKDAPETFEGYMSLVPSRDLLLEAIQELPAAKKAQLKARVLAARGKKTS